MSSTTKQRLPVVAQSADALSSDDEVLHYNQRPDQRNSALSSSSSSSSYGTSSDDKFDGVANSKDQNKSVSEKTDVKSATINMVKGFIGVGVLALPSGFAKSGWFGGLLFFAICSASIVYLSLKVVQAAKHRKSRASSVTEFWVECMGKQHEALANFFLLTIQLGICIAYLIFFATYFQESLCFFVNYDYESFFCGSRIPSLVVSVLLCAPSIFIKEMANLKLWSMVANTLIVFSLVVIITASTSQVDTTFLTSEYISAIRWTDIGSSIGIFIFAFEGTTLYFEVRSSMAQPNEFKHVLKYSLGGAIALFGLVGLIGYLAFGSKVRDIILFNFSMENPIFVFIQISYCIAILLSYPLQMFPVINIFEAHLLSYIENKHGVTRFNNNNNNHDNSNTVNSSLQKDNPNAAANKKSSSVARVSAKSVDDQEDSLEENTNNNNNTNNHSINNQNENNLNENMQQQQQQLQQLQSESEEQISKEFESQRNILRVCSLLLVVLVATLFSRISTFLNLVGSVSGCFFCFVLPVLTYEKSMPHIPRKIIQFHWGLMCLGIFFSIIGTYSSLKQLFS